MEELCCVPPHVRALSWLVRHSQMMQDRNCQPPLQGAALRLVLASRPQVTVAVL